MKLHVVNFMQLCVLFPPVAPRTSQSFLRSLVNFSPHISSSYSQVRKGKHDFMYLPSLGPANERHLISVTLKLGDPLGVEQASFCSPYNFIINVELTDVLEWDNMISCLSCCFTLCPIPALICPAQRPFL